MDSKKDLEGTQNALREYIEETAQNAIQLISEYVCYSNSLSFQTVQELKFSKRIFTLLLLNESKPKPLSIITLFDFDEDAIKEILHQICLIFTASGFEIKDDEKNYPLTKEDSASVLLMYNFLSVNKEFSIFSEYNSQEKENKCSLCLSSGDKKIEIISIDNSDSKYVGMLERQLSLFFAAIGKTVNISDGSIVNNYGCVVSPFDVD